MFGEVARQLEFYGEKVTSAIVEKSFGMYNACIYTLYFNCELRVKVVYEKRSIYRSCVFGDVVRQSEFTCSSKVKKERLH